MQISGKNAASREDVGLDLEGQHRGSVGIRRQHSTQEAAATFFSSYVSRKFMSGW